MANKESKQKVGFLMVGLKITQESEQCYMAAPPGRPPDPIPASVGHLSFQTSRQS